MVDRSKGAVRVENVHKTFRGKEHVLKGVSIDFPVGELTYILGSSGAGKSVLLKHILGLLRPDSGKVWVAGKDMSKLEGRELSEHRMVFGMFFQNSALFDDMTIFEKVAFPLREHTTLSEQEISDRVKSSLRNLGLGTTKDLDKFPNELSGGMKK